MSPPAADPRSAYEAWHAGLAYDDEANTEWHRLVKKHVRPDRDLEGRSVLEIGCGRGEFAAWLASHPSKPIRIVAADFAATAVGLAKWNATRRGITGIEWEIADIQQLGHRDKSFDTVISCETLEHLPDPKKALDELARILKPGGRLFLTTPNYLGLMGLYRAYRRLTGRPYTEVGQPINRFMVLPRTQRWIAATGLRILCTDGSGHYLPFPGRRPIAMPVLEKAGPLARKLALHSIVVATKDPVPAANP